MRRIETIPTLSAEITAGVARPGRSDAGQGGSDFIGIATTRRLPSSPRRQPYSKRSALPPGARALVPCYNVPRLRGRLPSFSMHVVKALKWPNIVKRGARLPRKWRRRCKWVGEWVGRWSERRRKESPMSRRSSRARARASRRQAGARLLLPARAAGRADPGGAVHRRQGQRGHAGPFKRYRSARGLRRGRSQEELEEAVRPTGFYRQKAKAVRACCRELVERFGGQVPRRARGAADPARRRPQDREHPARQRLRSPGNRRRYARRPALAAPRPHRTRPIPTRSRPTWPRSSRDEIRCAFAT